MFSWQKLKSKILIFVVLTVFILFTGCAVYQKLRPTGKHHIIDRMQIEDRFDFQVVNLPKVNDPTLIVRFGEYPVYVERRKVEMEGIKKTYGNNSGCLGLLVGIGYLIKGWYTSPDEEFVTEEGESYSAREAYLKVGGILSILGLAYVILYPEVEKVSMFETDSVHVENKKLFKPLPNYKIKVFLLDKFMDMTTDANGLVKINVAEYAEFVDMGEGLNLKFTAIEYPDVAKSVRISPTFFEELRNYYASIRPPSLITTVSFNDQSSFTANKLIDGGEQAYLVVNIENKGEGKALAVKLDINNSNPALSVTKALTVGNIPPGERLRKRIPIKANLNLSDGSAVLMVYTREQRGYNARPVKFQVQTRHLDKPKFKWIRLEVNDANVGRASGNGNGIPENGETIELKAYVKNVGEGKAYDVTLTLIDWPKELNIVQQTDNLGTLLPGESRTAKVVFSIPTTYTAKSIPVRLQLGDALKADVSYKQETLTMGVNLPVLAYQINKPALIHNGGEFTFQITPQNVGKLAARGVHLQIISPDQITVSGGGIAIGSIPPGSQATPQAVTVTIPRTYSRSHITLSVRLTQRDFEGVTRSEVIPIQLWKPQLEIVEQLRDANGNGQIEQGERVELTITVSNAGQLAAEGVTLEMEATDSRFNDRVVLGTIPPQGAESHTFILNIPWGISTGAFPITLRASQHNFATATKTLPYEIVSGEVLVQRVQGETQPTASVPIGSVSRDQVPSVSVLNLRKGETIVESPYPVTVTVGDDQQLTDVKLRLNGQIVFDAKTDPEAQQQLKFNNKLLTVNTLLQNLKQGENVLEITAVDNANQIHASSISFQYYRGKPVVANVVLNPSIDIERDIPRKKRINPDAVAVIFGIERYKKITKVTYARRDAVVFREYAVKVLGVPEDRIYLAIDEDATGMEFRKVFSRGGWLERRVKTGSDVYVYYAGHGAPDIEGREPYIIPYDGDVNYPRLTGYSIKTLYDQLSRLSVRSVTVFLDACFSGFNRENEILLAEARPVGLHLESPMLTSPKMVAFSASSGVQISSSFPEKKHGLFTYFLLKGIKGDADYNQDRKITIGELDRYLSEHVPNIAAQMDREQTPQVNALDKEKSLVEF